VEDFVPVGFVLNIHRSQHVDFSTPIFQKSFGNFINTNKKSSKWDWPFYLRPFNQTVWICAAGRTNFK
jgi:hypothetical protein